MRLIADANVLFAALMKPGLNRRLLVSDELQLFTPPYLFIEFRAHKHTLLSASRRSEAEFENMVKVLRRRIKTLPKAEYTNFLEEAETLLTDKDDAAYLAACLATGLPLWSNDAGFKRQRKVIVYTTKELAGCLGLE